MKQVDKEIMVILKDHQKEKQKMQAEIDDLRSQLTQQHNSSVFVRNPSVRSFSQNRGSSSMRESSHHSSVSKDVVQECLSKFTGVQLKTNTLQKNFTSESKRSLSRQSSLKKSTTSNPQKENMFIPNNSITEEEQYGILPLKSVSNVPPRGKRFKERKKNF